MQDLLRDLIFVAAWTGMLLYVVIPVWFICRIVGLIASPSPLLKLKKSWPVYLALGTATFFILYVLDLFPPRSEIPFPYDHPVASSTTEMIDQADAIAEGSFLLDRTISSSRDVFTGPFYQHLKANVFIVPFQIDQAVKGPASGTINIKLFFTFWPNTPFYRGLPLKEKLLLILRQDPHDEKTYIISSQNTGWLVLAHPHAAGSMPADPATFILDDAKGFLAACLEHPGTSAAIAYMTQPTAFGSALDLLGGGFSTINYPQTDPARLQALRIGKDLGLPDPEFLALAKKYEGEYGELGDLARKIRADSGDYSEIEAGLKSHDAQPASPPTNGFHILGSAGSYLPSELTDAIQSSSHPADLLPIVTQALASPDPHMREIVMQALYWYAGRNGYGQRGNRLGNEYFPIAARMLDDPDQKVQYSALGCIFCMSGEVKKRVPNREVNLPAVTIFEQDPDLYIGKAKAWWEKHKTELMGGPLPSQPGG